MLKFKYWIFLFTSHSLYALTTLNVTSSSDNNPGGIGEVGDLRYVLNSMNQSLNNIPDDYEIVFSSPMTIQLNGLLPIINNSLNPVNITIGNSGASPNVTIDGNNTYSGFFIPTGNVNIQNMIFQNLTAKGGNGGNGISGGGGGMGAGGAIYATQTFLNGSNPSITLMNVSINNCSAIGGNGGNSLSFSGNEGAGGGGGFSGNGGSVTAIGSSGGGGGGGFGGDGGLVNFSTDNQGGGGGGGGGFGSRATIGTLTNLGTGGIDEDNGLDGNCYGLNNPTHAGSGGGGYSGGDNAGGGGGGGPMGESSFFGGGGGGSLGTNGTIPQGSTPPGNGIIPSGGNGVDGGGGGGAGIVITIMMNGTDGKAGSGGYGGGGGGGAGTGASDDGYTVEGGSGGVGGGGGGGGCNQSSLTPANGGSSFGGGGGGGGGPTNTSPEIGVAIGGTDMGRLGGGAGGNGANSVGPEFSGGGGGGGSGIGGAIFIDSNLNFTIQAIPGIPTVFNTSNNSVEAGTHGSSGSGGSPGVDGSALGNSIFLRSGSDLTLVAEDVNDLLTLGDQVSFADDTIFGAGNTSIQVIGNGTVIYNGTTDYQGMIRISNANFKVNGFIDQASVLVCRNQFFSSQRGTLSGSGTLSGAVFANSGTISPDAGTTLTLGSLFLTPIDLINDTIGSVVQIKIDSNSASSVSVNGSVSLGGTLEIILDPQVNEGSYILLTSSTLSGAFDLVSFTGPTPNYTISYLPIGNPTYVQLDINSSPPPSDLLPPTNLLGKQKKNDFGFEYELYNELNWTKSPSTDVNGYFIYRNGKKIAAVDANTYTYQDHDRKKGSSYTYAITAFNSNEESSQVNIVIRP